MKKTVTACIGLLVFVNCVFAQQPPKIIIHEDIVYSESDANLMMDLYLPRHTDEPVPCVIVIKGGGFMAQDGKKSRPRGMYLAKNGFAAALIAYRGRPKHKYRDTIADTKTAVRFLRKISAQYNIDPDRIGAAGGSAGGTLVALLAVTGGMAEYEGQQGGHSEFSSRIQAGVGFAGVYDFVSRFTDQEQISLQPEVKTKIVTNGEWIGEDFAPDNEHWHKASAVNHLDQADPPLLLIHCKDDSVVPWIQSRDMHKKMKNAGIRAEIEYYEKGGHGFRTEDPEEPKARMVAFFKKTLVKK